MSKRGTQSKREHLESGLVYQYRLIAGQRRRSTLLWFNNIPHRPPTTPVLWSSVLKVTSRIYYMPATTSIAEKHGHHRHHHEHIPLHSNIALASWLLLLLLLVIDIGHPSMFNNDDAIRASGGKMGRYLFRWKNVKYLCFDQAPLIRAAKC